MATNRITFGIDGIYSLNIALQFYNTAASIHDATFWIRKNGVDLAASAYYVSVNERHGGVDGTVLANEEVIDGRSERGNHPCVRKVLRQWMLKITAYADRLLEDLALVDWTESIKEMQKNWIGRSEGVEVHFPYDLSTIGKSGVIYAAGGATTIWVDVVNKKAKNLPDWLRALVS